MDILLLRWHIQTSKIFSSRLFFGRLKTIPPVVGALSTFPVNKSRLGLHEPVTSSNYKYKSSLCASCKIIGAVTGKSGFQPLTTFGQLKRRGRMGKKSGCHEWWKTPGNCQQPRCLCETPFLCAKHTGSWLSVLGTTWHNIVSQFLCACFNVNPPNLQNKCNCCL